MRKSREDMRCAQSFLCVVFTIIFMGIGAFWVLILSKDVLEPCGFKCPENNVCITSAQVCNNFPDCPNGTDEDFTHCHDVNRTIFSIMRAFQCDLDVTSEIKKIMTKNGTIPLTTKPPRKKGDRNCTTIDQCTICNEAAVVCKDVDGVVPWHIIGEYRKGLTLKNVFADKNISILQDQLVPPQGTKIVKVYLEDNHIPILGNYSICNWEYTCSIMLSNNGIKELSLNTFCPLPRIHGLWFSNNELTLENYSFPDLSPLSDLFLDQNHIEVITDETFKNLRSLDTLKLQDNRIRYVGARAFAQNLKLRDLDLSANRLTTLASTVLLHQGSLHVLNLTGNPFNTIPGEVFESLTGLESLYMEGIQFYAIDFDVINNLPNLGRVYFKSFSYCRFIPRVTRCFPQSDGMSNLKNLLAGPGHRWMVWIVAIFTMTGNIIVIITRCCANRSHRRGLDCRVADVFISNLAGADFLMGIYLTVLALKDIEYRDLFHSNAYSWSTSLLCTLIGAIGMTSCEVSLLILTFLSVERYLVIRAGISRHKKLSLNLSRVAMVMIWVVVIFIAIAPAIQWNGNFSFYGSSGLCFPVHLDDPFATGWLYTGFLFGGLNTFCLTVVAVSYTMLYCIVRDTRVSVPTAMESKDIEMATRFFLMVFTDIMCWLPIIVLRIMASRGFHIPQEVVTWIVIFVLPINSAINPYLYTLWMPENRKMIRRLTAVIPIDRMRRAIQSRQRTSVIVPANAIPNGGDSRGTGMTSENGTGQKEKDRRRSNRSSLPSATPF